MKLIRNNDEYISAMALHRFLCLKPEYGGSRFSDIKKRLKVFKAIRIYEMKQYRSMWE